MIDGPGQLDAIGAELAPGVNSTSVVDQDLDARVSRQRIGRQLPDAGLRREVRGQHVHDRPAGSGPDLASRIGRPRLAARNEGELRSTPRELDRRRQSNAPGRPGDQDSLSADASPRRH